MKRFFKILSITAAVAIVFAVGFFEINGSRGKTAFRYSENSISDLSEKSGNRSSQKIIKIKNSTDISGKRRYVGIGGDAFGIKMYTKGIMIVGIDSVTSKNGNKNPAAEAGLKSGDIIKTINGVNAESADGLTKTIENSNGKEILLGIERNGENFTLKLKPAAAADGKYKAGIWVRDSSAGIGTVTFYDDERKLFGGLGHGVCDIDTGKIMPLSDGEAVKATVNGCYKSNPGNPGELCGTFSDKPMGVLAANLESGIFGSLEYPSGARQIPVALENEVKPGAAQIVTSLNSDGAKYYDVEITKIYPLSDRSTRNMIIKITDPELIEKTGGIVQGMSGSPIIQNSMLVGAVTHVFVNEPSQGYGIFASRMLNSLDEVIDGKKEAA